MSARDAVMREELRRARVDGELPVVMDVTERWSDETLRDTEAMKAALAGAGWKTARQIAQALGFDDRYLRLCAEASRGEIISGQKGYKLTREATPEEIQHAEAWLVSQAKRMMDRARLIRVAMNRRSFQDQ